MSLSPCIQTYANVSFNSSIFWEHEASTALLPSVSGGNFFALAGDYPALANTDCAPETRPQGNKTQPTALLPNGLRYVNFTESQQGSDIMFYDPRCVYTLGYGPTTGLQAALLHFFGTIAEPKNVTLPRGINGQKVGDAWLLALLGDGEPDVNSTTRYLGGLADAITATMRENGDRTNSAPALGSAFITQTCVGVRWGWLSFPAALVALTLLFMLTTMAISQHSTRMGTAGYMRTPWKSSSLPLLWCGIRDKTKAKYRRFDEVEKMKDSGDETYVALKREVWFDSDGANRDWNNQDRWALKEA